MSKCVSKHLWNTFCSWIQLWVGWHILHIPHIIHGINGANRVTTTRQLVYAERVERTDIKHRAEIARWCSWKTIFNNFKDVDSTILPSLNQCTCSVYTPPTHPLPFYFQTYTYTCTMHTHTIHIISFSEYIFFPCTLLEFNGPSVTNFVWCI